MKKLITIIFSLLISLCAHAQQRTNNEAYAEAELSSNQLIPGETATLEIRIIGGSPDSKPEAPLISGISLRFTGTQRQFSNQGPPTFVFNYQLRPEKSGSYTIPSFVISSKGKLLETRPLNFHVHDSSTLQKVSTGIDGYDLLATWIPEKEILYPGEQTPVTLKLYAPAVLNVVNWGILDPEKENSLAWRFASSGRDSNRVNIGDKQYITENLSSTISGIAPGTASLKQGKLELVIRQLVSKQGFRRRYNDFPLQVVIPDLDLKIIPFPSGAPKNFHGAVGNFEMISHSEKPSFLSNEPTEVIIQVGGIGNIESLKVPTLGKSPYPDLDWKIINTSKEARGRERRELTGVVTFRQILRPLVKDKAVLNNNDLHIPAYSFSFFNPFTKEYKTITAPPIPVTITAAAEEPLTEEEKSSPPSPEPPAEEMAEILDIIQTPDDSLTLSEPNQSYFSRIPLWFFIPAALCLFILFSPLQKKAIRRFAKTPDQKEKQQDLRALSKQSNSAEFHSSAGRYISRWIRGKDLKDDESDELQEITKTRDSLCFQSAEVSQETVQPNRKKEIIELLKRLSIITLTTVSIGIGTFLSSHNLSAAETPEQDASSPYSSYIKGEYQEAIDLYQQTYPSATNSIYGTPADVFYNIGNNYQKLKKPGMAALAWRRALAVDSTHNQARTNLRFIEKETLAYNKNYLPWQTNLTKYSVGFYRLLYQVSIWVFVLSLLVLIFLRSTSWLQTNSWVTITLLIITPFIAALGITAEYFYPDTGYHTAFTEQAVVTEKANLYQQAKRDKSNYQVIPPASLVKIIATRGPWARIQIIEKREQTQPQEGWVRKDTIYPVTSKTF